MTNGSTQLHLPAVREDRGRFAALHDARVLIYWPHGLGDWVHFGSVLPLLEPSNAYAITRIGDDYVSLMEGCSGVVPIFSGVRAPSDGRNLGVSHFGLTLRRCNGRNVRIELPEPLGAAVRGFAPTIVLWTDYPETEGRTPYPFHTKARNAARLLVQRKRLASFDLAQPLKNAIDFTPDPQIVRLVDERLARFAAPSSRLGMISRRGVTAARKNWGEGAEARAFVAAMRGRSEWRFISMDEENLGDGVAGFRALFADIDQPFARLFKAVARRVDLFVGIPAGPLHFMLARGGVPVIGLWLSHHPDWYDEPNSNAVHLIGRYVRDRGFDRRPASTTKPPALLHRIEYLDTVAIGADAVVESARKLIA